MNDGRALRNCGHRIDHRGKPFQVNAHELGGIARLVSCFCHHDGDQVASEANLLAVEKRPPWERTALRTTLREGGQSLKVSGGEDGHHSARLPCGLNIDRSHRGVRHVAPNEGDVTQPGKRDIVEVHARAGYEPRIYPATHPSADGVGERHNARLRTNLSAKRP